MAAIPRSADDIIIDNMVTALETFAAEQVVEDPAVGFTVDRDLVRPLASGRLPMVNLWLDSIDTQANGSSAKTVGAELARINVDCYTQGLELDDEDEDDGKAMARLYYLKEQVKAGLYRLVNADFGLPAGTIGRKRWPRWTTMPQDLSQPETEIVAGRWVVEIEYSWQPEDIADVPLDQIQVNAGRWSGLYQY